ncbi:MAG: helix-turn-helix domain-containing protein [Patescibacteria group bacterium]
MNVKGELMSLGLSKNEAAVYLALLEQGLSQSGPIIKSTKLHRMLVYNALDRLVDEGLVTVVHKKNIKLFQAADPTSLLERTRRINSKAESLVPELRRLQEAEGSAVTVRTLFGPEGLRTNLEDIIESAARQKDKTISIIGGAKDSAFYDTVGDWYENYVDLLKKYGVRKRLLSPANFSDEFKKKFRAEKGTEMKTLPTGLSAPSYTRITKEMVSIETYYPTVLVIQIRNPILAEAYLDSFELLWKSTKGR